MYGVLHQVDAALTCIPDMTSSFYAMRCMLAWQGPEGARRGGLFIQQRCLHVSSTDAHGPGPGAARAAADRCCAAACAARKRAGDPAGGEHRPHHGAGGAGGGRAAGRPCRRALAAASYLQVRDMTLKRVGAACHRNHHDVRQ